MRPRLCFGAKNHMQQKVQAGTVCWWNGNLMSLTSWTGTHACSGKKTTLGQKRACWPYQVRMVTKQRVLSCQLLSNVSSLSRGVRKDILEELEKACCHDMQLQCQPEWVGGL